ncbi:MAG: FAD-dependent oxidoreductase [Proteobacteria bacterium]|nr:FAD-dependent oxidoreductase [Pseudomonadota bacterium]
MAEFPTQARALIIGGGIVGCSTAYHLAGLGWREVVLLERHKLTSGSTFHAAGLVGQLRSSANITQLLKYSVELYDTLEAETGLATGWKRNGGLRLACNGERMIEIERQATMAHSFGLEMDLLSPREAQDLWPLMDISDVVGAAYLPTDGQVNPSDITQALAKGARTKGVRIIEDCPVTAITMVNGRVTGISTPQGDIACEVVVNCAGQWAREVGALAGVVVPLQSVHHQYLITEAIDGIEPGLPTLRDPDRLTYFKEDVGGLVMGGYEPNPIPWALDGIPEGFHFSLLDTDIDHFEQLMEQALIRVPALAEAGVKEMINGPESFTPDGNFILGEAPEVAGFFVGAGFNAFGIAAGGGAGKALAEWVVGGEAPIDLWVVDIKRFAGLHGDHDFVRERTLELYGKHYTIAWPHEEHESGRPRRVSPLYARLKAQGAAFGSKLGWERPNWFAPDGVEPAYVYSFGRQNWFEHSAVEHQAVREGVGIFDQSSFVKFLLQGRDSERVLNRVSAGDVAVPVGKVVYTAWLNERGGFESDLTVTRVAEDAFLIVTSATSQTRDFAWLKRNIPEGAHATLTDVTSGYAVLGVMGPGSREFLAPLTDADLSNDAFPFGTSQEIDLGYARVRAMRITYVGELGWEIYIPTEFATAVYDVLVDAGEAHGLVQCGYHALNSLRMEKLYRHWGHDITDEDTPLEAGLGFAVAWDKADGFIGREALLSQREEGVTKRLAGFILEDADPLMYQEEPIWRDGEMVGAITSAMFGHTLGRSIGLGYVSHPGGVTAEVVKAGTYEIEIAGVRYPASVSLAPFHDPGNERVKS